MGRDSHKSHAPLSLVDHIEFAVPTSLYL